MSQVKDTVNEKVLGFNPSSGKLSKEILEFAVKTLHNTGEKIFPMIMTPQKAKYILEKLNKANRKFVKSQQNAIGKSWDDWGWLFDGGVCAFNTDGYLTEFQHRLQEIVDRGETVVVWCGTGVKPDTFTRAAPPKNRTKWDAVYKTDNTATKDEVTTLEQILKRRKGDTLTMVNAPEEFAKWADFVRKGMASTNDFFDIGGKQRAVTMFDPWYRQFNSWAALLIYNGDDNGGIVEEFLSLLKKHLTAVDPKDKCALFTGMDIFFRSKDVGYLAGEKKAAQLWFMLCHATDRFLEYRDGKCQWDLKFVDANHGTMKKKSPTYYSFLADPQGINKAVKLLNKKP